MQKYANPHDFYDVLHVEVDKETGTPTLQLGAVKTNEVYDNGSEIWQTFGFCSLPAPPEPGKSAAQVMTVEDSHSLIAIGGKDFRSQKMYGALKPGETAVYASLGQARILLKKDGGINLITTEDNTEDGTNVIAHVGPDGIKFAGPWGALTIDENGIQMAHKNGAYLKLGADGNATIGGKQVSVAGGSVALGVGATPVTAAVAGIPGTSGALGKASTCVFITP